MKNIIFAKVNRIHRMHRSISREFNQRNDYPPPDRTKVPISTARVKM